MEVKTTMETFFIEVLMFTLIALAFASIKYVRYVNVTLEMVLMNLEDQFGLEHLLFEQRKCKICGETKELINDFYKTRKDRGNVPSAYAYECKRCSIKRVSEKRKRKELVDTYPDW